MRSDGLRFVETFSGSLRIPNVVAGDTAQKVLMAVLLLGGRGRWWQLEAATMMCFRRPGLPAASIAALLRLCGT